MTRGPGRAPAEIVLLSALAIFAAVNVSCWIHVLPLGDAPDEHSHYEVVLFEAVFRAIPEVGVDDFAAIVRLGADGYRSPLYTYSAQPGLSYIVSAAAIELLGDRSPESAIYARYPGVIWAAAMPLIAFWGVRRMYPRTRGAAAIAATVAAFWPQLAFVFSYTNNDGMTAVASTALVASWLAGARAGWRMRDAVLTGCLVGIVFLNKPNGYPIGALTAGAMALTLREGFRTSVLRCAAAAAAAVAVSGWWWMIAWQRYGFDLLAEGRANSVRESLGVAWAAGRTYGMSMLETAIGRYPRFYAKTWLEGTLTSGIGEFGALTIGLPAGVYLLVGALTAAALAGTAWSAANGNGGDDRRFVLLKLLVYALLPLELLLSLYRSWAFDFQAQGRYLFPALISLLALYGAGLGGSSRRGRSWRLRGLITSLTFAGIGVYAFAVTLLEGYRSSLVEFVSERSLHGWLWVCATLFVTGAIAAYWISVEVDEASHLEEDEARAG